MSATSRFVTYQFDVYLQGLAGQQSPLPLRYEDLEARARDVMEPGPFWYVAGGAGEDTLRANREAFRRYRIVPRMLRDVSGRDLSIRLLNTDLKVPLLLAPIGVQGVIHPDAEIAVARAAASLGIPLILSTLSSHPLEQVAEAMGKVPRWFQLYWPKDNELTKSLLTRAEAAGFSALVVTLDTKMLGWRTRELEQGYLPWLTGQGLANYFTDPVFRAALQVPPEQDQPAAITAWREVFTDPSQTWDDLASLREYTWLPIVLKGIQHPDDARLAAELGIDGIIVSNHGGRQVDGAIGALEALPAIVAAVGQRLPILFDSGIRTGADMFKALALGANAVLLGRPYIWGLALAGEAGVREVVQRLLADFDLTLGLAGYNSVHQLGPAALSQA
jgi:isopentenyl diphosphate isomerase/L-lactate dehydrogenase-like FMN-dependent dehydrogenase